MKIRNFISGLVLVVLGLGLGATVVAFNRDSRVQPFAFLYRATDKVEQEVTEFLRSPESGPAVEYFSTTFTGIDGTIVTLPRADMFGQGGGVAAVGDEALILTFRGVVFLVNDDGTYSRSGIVVPDHGLEAYAAVGEVPPFETFNINVSLLRYNEIEYLQSEQGRFLFITYTEFHEGENCFTLTAARLALPDTPLRNVLAAEDDWEVVFRSDPCLPLREGGPAILGSQAAGMIAFSANGDIAYLTVGEYGWNGWSSDGRTELSRIALSQYPDADYGKVVRIDLNTLEARHFSSGHRNAQGLTVDGEGRVWSVEHGPRGGDELNLIEDGNNYGWPNVTFGTAYNGEPIPGVQSVGRHTGYALPAYSWLPSVGISGLTAMHSSFHPTWDGDLIAVSLVGRTLFRIRLDGNRVVFTEEIALGRRLRDIEQLEDGRLVVWTDSNEVIFLAPVDGGLGAQFVSRYLDNLATSTPDLAAAMNEMVVECSECHSFSSREHRIGPDLSNVSGRGIGAIESFEYSPALLGASGTWTANYLAEFLDDPDGVFPGTTMPDPGIDDPQVIDAMVELLDALAQAELRD